MDAPSTVPFGDLLRRYRSAAGLTQEELAAHRDAHGETADEIFEVFEGE